MEKGNELAPIKIGNYVFIDAYITIGDRVIIGVGALVSKDISPNAIVFGLPIQLKRYRFDDDISMNLRRVKR